jgi:uncharacterized protein YbbC (DUF1343 family)
MKFFHLMFAMFLSLNIHIFSQENKTVSTPWLRQTEFKTGLEVLKESGFEALKNKRVGLVTNPTGVDRNMKSTIDIFHDSPNVNLVALFGPEHGVRGNFSAGDLVNNQIDEKTGIPIYSLYGSNRKPDAQALEHVDVLVYDIQDIGVRSYTYISTMGLVMEAAAETGKEVIILDRPNPLGGQRIEGSMVEEGFFSFVSQYPIPYVYGLTCGELALMFNGESYLKEGVKANLKVIGMKGWTRDMIYHKTGLIWVPSSPHIPSFETAFYYAATGIIGEIDPNLIGIGYTLPFQTLVTENIDANKLADAMNGLKLKGVLFRPIYFKPYYKEKQGQELQGVQIHITDFNQVNLSEIQFYFLQVAGKLDSNFNIFKGKENRYNMFDKVCGTDYIRKNLMSNKSFDQIKSYWEKDIRVFRELSSKYYLYD